jgi:GNAT superfamily N-acetyltransferase
MKTKSLFFISLIVIIFIQTPHIHGMLTRKTPQAFSFSKHALQVRTCTRIVPYDPEKHAKNVFPIIVQNVHRLESEVNEQNRHEWAQKMMTAINNPKMKSCVFLNHDTDKPVGVINYYFEDQSYKRFTDIFKLDVPQNAVIQIIAVDEEQQGKKIGSRLLQHVLDACTQQGVYKVSLSTITSKLEKFYEEKHGFTCTWYGPAVRSSYSEFAKWLQPQHPVIAIFMALFNSQHKK